MMDRDTITVDLPSLTIRTLSVQARLAKGLDTIALTELTERMLPLLILTLAQFRKLRCRLVAHLTLTTMVLAMTTEDLLNHMTKIQSALERSVRDQDIIVSIGQMARTRPLPTSILVLYLRPRPVVLPTQIMTELDMIIED